MRSRFDNLRLSILLTALTACELDGSLRHSLNPELRLDASIVQLDAAFDAGSNATHTTSSTRIDELTVSGRSNHTAATTPSEMTGSASVTAVESTSLTSVPTSSDKQTATTTVTTPSAPPLTVDHNTELLSDDNTGSQTTPPTTATHADTSVAFAVDASVEEPSWDAAVTLAPGSGQQSTSPLPTTDTTNAEKTSALASDSSTQVELSTTAASLSNTVESTASHQASTSSPTTRAPETTAADTTQAGTTQLRTTESIATSLATTANDASASTRDAGTDADASNGDETSAQASSSVATSLATWSDRESTAHTFDASSDASIGEADGSLVESQADGGTRDAAQPTLDANLPPAPQDNDASLDAAVAVCDDDNLRPTDEMCGLNDRGRVEEVCSAGTWSTLGCTDPDVCIDQTSLTFPCEGEALGVQVCIAGAWQDVTSCPATASCANDDTRMGSTPCGVNLRGGLLQACVDGAWLDTNSCTDPDACEDDTTGLGAVPCGMNGRGLRAQLCVAGQWTDADGCEDADVCTDGASESIGVNCGLNTRGLLYHRCQAGQWGSSECEDPDVCPDDAEQFIGACGINVQGRLVQTCSAGQWSPNECADSDTCLNTSVRLGDAPCGLNSRGHLEQVCTTGQWQTTSVCADVDVCVDTSTRSGTTVCELDAGGTFIQVCVNGNWTDTEACQPSELCNDTTTRVGSSTCGLNGRGWVPQVCVEGVWQDSSDCDDPDTCLDETVEPSRMPCGINQRGYLSNECTSGRWSLTDSCVDPDQCVDGASKPSTAACGLNQRGLFDQTCITGVWVEGVNCNDPDECVDGTNQLGTTPCEGRGVLQQDCDLGTWVDGATCIKPRVTQPNILLVIADDVGAEATSIYPNVAGTATPVPAPTIEGLAAQGLTFDNAWASPMCSPTRATVLSGKYGNRTGVTTAGLELPTTHETLHERIGAESPSYSMGVFGKWHLSGTNSNQDQATEVLHVLASGVPTFRGFMGAAVENFFRWEAVDQTGAVSLIEQYSTTSITDWAIEYIQQQEAETPDAPWFVYVPYNAAHDPYQVPPSSLHHVDVGGLAEGAATTSIPVYKAMLQALDTELGRLLNVVNLDETIVIYMGDNGTPGEVKEQGSNVRGSKQGVYEGGVRVPLVISGAGVTRVGEREDDLVVSSDLYATILSLTGIETPQIYDSFALNPLFETPDSSTGRTHSFTELCNGIGSHYAVRNAQYKLLYEDRRFQLYDLWNDPRETRNLYNDATVSGVRSELEAALSQIRAGSSAGCFR